MGKAKGLLSDIHGQVGRLIVVHRKNCDHPIVYEAREVSKTTQRTEDQAAMRMLFGNMGAIYSQLKPYLANAFEGNGKMNAYNAFVQANSKLCKVYITKDIRLNGGCVLAPYLVSRGMLTSILYTKNRGDMLVTDISLGGLVIDDNTTVAELSAAVISCNDNWEEGDQLSFIHGVQTHDPVTGVPRAKMNGSKVVLNLTDDTPLMVMVNAIGFSTVGGFLGMSQPITESAAAWIHSRDKDGDVTVSTQHLFVDPAVYASYQGQDAFNASVNSYGGTSKGSAFLSPKSNQ
jgi:hypothetical protein